MINFNCTSFVSEAIQLLAIIMKEIVLSTKDKRTKVKQLKEKCAGYGFKYEAISRDLRELKIKYFCRNIESKAVIKVGNRGTTITLDIEEGMLS